MFVRIKSFGSENFALLDIFYKPLISTIEFKPGRWDIRMIQVWFVIEKHHIHNYKTCIVKELNVGCWKASLE